MTNDVPGVMNVHRFTVHPAAGPRRTTNRQPENQAASVKNDQNEPKPTKHELNAQEFNAVADGTSLKCGFRRRSRFPAFPTQISMPA